MNQGLGEIFSCKKSHARKARVSVPVNERVVNKSYVIRDFEGVRWKGCWSPNEQKGQIKMPIMRRKGK
jgi:hypothetical protein